MIKKTYQPVDEGVRDLEHYDGNGQPSDGEKDLQSPLRDGLHGIHDVRGHLGGGRRPNCRRTSRRQSGKRRGRPECRRPSLPSHGTPHLGEGRE